LNEMLDPVVIRIISAGEFKAGTPNVPSENAIPRSEQYGGALLSNDVTDMLNFIRSDSPQFLKKNGYTKHQLEELPTYLQGNAPTQYSSAVTYAKNGQFGKPVDLTSQDAVTINIVDLNQDGVRCASSSGCFSMPSVKVKVGTTITWVNKSKMPHTVTAVDGENLSPPKAAPKILRSSPPADALIPSGKEFSATVTMDMYNANKSTHEVIYYCEIHPDMLAKLIIVP
jgi:plastocyanin